MEGASQAFTYPEPGYRYLENVNLVSTKFMFLEKRASCVSYLGSDCIADQVSSLRVSVCLVWTDAEDGVGSFCVG